MLDNHMYILVGKTAITTGDALLWAMFMEHENRQVDRTEINGVSVSTVFLGLNHNYWGGVPILFETMVFGGAYDQYQRRYATWEEAEQGHKEAVALIEEEQRVDDLISNSLKQEDEPNDGSSQGNY